MNNIGNHNLDLIKSLGLSGDVLTSAKDLNHYAKDASIFTIKPLLAIAPRDSNDISKLINFVTEQNKQGCKLSLTARSAGTCMSGGPLTDSIVLDFTKYFNNVGEVSGDCIDTQMGAYYRDFEKITLKNNLLLPSYPASKDLCAMGGIVNNNSAGEKTLKYGKTLNYLEEISMVCSDGQTYTFKEESESEWERICNEDKTLYGDIHRNIDKLLKENKDEIEINRPSVSKNSSGYYLWEIYNSKTNTYNLAKLICGAQGTLGMVMNAKLKLIENKKHSRMIVMFIKNVGDLPTITEKVNSFKPESFELYDDHTFKIAMRFWPDIARKMGGNLFKLGIQFIPEFKMVLLGGIPKLVLLAEFTGNDKQELDKLTNDAYASLIEDFGSNNDIKMHLVKDDETKKYWTFRRESFNLLRSKLSDMRTVPFIEDIVIHQKDFPTFLPRFEKLLDEYKLIYTIAGHVGDGNLHVIPLMKLREDHNVEVVRELSEKVYSLVSEYKGSISGEHNDGLIRTPFLHYMFTPKMLELFQEVKNIFDPLNIFNPNKKVGGSWDNSLKHIDRSV